jgi:hypothetical protein
LTKRGIRYHSRLYKQLDVTEPRRETDTFGEPCWRKIRLLGPGLVMFATGKKRKKLREIRIVSRRNSRNVKEKY